MTKVERLLQMQRAFAIRYEKSIRKENIACARYWHRELSKVEDELLKLQGYVIHV